MSKVIYQLTDKACILKVVEERRLKVPMAIVIGFV